MTRMEMDEQNVSDYQGVSPPETRNRCSSTVGCEFLMSVLVYCNKANKERKRKDNLFLFDDENGDYLTHSKNNYLIT